MHDSAKVIVITGASSGIGEAIARRLGGAGARLALGARRVDRLAAVARDVIAAGGDALALATDVTRRADVDALVAAAVARYGRVDVIVNNAGLMPLSPLAQRKVDEWDRMIDVNIRGVLHGIAATLPLFAEQKAGHVINISSVADRGVFPTAAVYCATKFAVRALSEGLRQEAGPHLRVTLIAPGATESELANTISDPQFRAEAIASFRKDLLAADAIARAVAFAIEQPAEVDVNELVVRPTAQAY